MDHILLIYSYRELMKLEKHILYYLTSKHKWVEKNEAQASFF